MRKLILFIPFILMSFFVNAQYVETTPEGGFWSVIPGLANPATPSFVPVNGIGTRLMWLPTRGAFRAGGVNSDYWDADSIGRYSFAAGFNTVASGSNTIALGLFARARGNYSTSLGRLTTASGESSAAFGYNSVASGKTSTAMGSETKATGNYSTALGYKSEATGESSFAAGNVAKATGINAVAMGSDVNANGTNSVAIGGGTNASNLGSVALGYLTSSFATGSTALGWSSEAHGPASTAMGRETKAVGEQSFAAGYLTEANGVYSFAAGNKAKAQKDDSFAFGNAANASGIGAIAIGFETSVGKDNGVAIGYRANTNGEQAVALGLGTADGDFSYAIGHVAWATGKYSTAMGNHTNTNSKEGAFVIGDSYTGATELLSDANNRMSARFRNGYYFYTNASNTIGARLLGNGTAWSSISDSTKKENFLAADLEKVLNSISQMRIGTWNYKEVGSKDRHWGVMAQDFFKHFGKDALGTIGNDKSISTLDFDGVSFAAIKGLEQRTRDLKAELRQAQFDREEMKKEIERLRTTNQKLTQTEKQNQEKFATIQNQLEDLKQLLMANGMEQKAIQQSED